MFPHILLLLLLPTAHTLTCTHLTSLTASLSFTSTAPVGCCGIVGVECNTNRVTSIRWDREIVHVRGEFNGVLDGLVRLSVKGQSGLFGTVSVMRDVMDSHSSRYVRDVNYDVDVDVDVDVRGSGVLVKRMGRTLTSRTAQVEEQVEEMPVHSIRTRLTQRDLPQIGGPDNRILPDPIQLDTADNAIWYALAAIVGSTLLFITCLLICKCGQKTSFPTTNPSLSRRRSSIGHVSLPRTLARPLPRSSSLAKDDPSAVETAQEFIAANHNKKEFPVAKVHVKTAPDEMNLVPGDRIVLMRVFTDGWAEGVSKRAGGPFCFPVVCLGGSVPRVLVSRYGAAQESISQRMQTERVQPNLPPVPPMYARPGPSGGNPGAPNMGPSMGPSFMAPPKPSLKYVQGRGFRPQIVPPAPPSSPSLPTLPQQQQGYLGQNRNVQSIYTDL
ncbi:uncharacterized protein SPPG_01811 [Spizellomyces punctatus DAOM BR117]|uniref:SH3 domain-containing protein n=1 Tax=Spizellomyces punctatus (strain DAOM BR117) TaxID=645134 RepID=A0A0L0HNU2_SPIPD|nr:uncharacterized protein SPPG_01811 [Spizellomyces punctatus DAOM BR117]KND02728.1 hypothetical protein SPPG_01811 [Spizellomyces punctatus DAOM BR117]|eukprot:XP_016610767.1 hypothetical protein SPPG_01811 [Spizellomyces punctatus DAOM BR117]